MKLTPAYFKLVKKFPLVCLRDDEHLAEATELIDELLTHELDVGSQAYLDALSVLVLAYEEKHVTIVDVSPREVLHSLMTSNEVSRQQLVNQAGIAQSTLSRLLSGNQEFNHDHMTKLGKFFGVEPSVFIRKVHKEKRDG